MYFYLILRICINFIFGFLTVMIISWLKIPMSIYVAYFQELKQNFLLLFCPEEGHNFFKNVTCCAMHKPDISLVAPHQIVCLNCD